MEGWAFAAALLSALLHASWNAAAKASPDPGATMAAQMVGAALLVLPALPWVGWPAPAAWGWMAASVALNAVAVRALARAYASGGFGMVYAVVRATSVLLVVPLAAWLAGERSGPLALAGVGLVCAALLALGAGGEALLARRAWPPTLLAGVATAGYVICDARGVRASGDAIGYAVAMTIANGVAMGFVAPGRRAPWATLAADWRRVLPLTLASTASYALILWAYAHAPIARSAALRDTSAAWGLLIAALWLHEPLTRRRAAVLALALAGVACLRLDAPL